MTVKKKNEEVARELVSVLPKKGGCREGMYHDILHALSSEWNQAISEAVRVILESKEKMPEEWSEYCDGGTADCIQSWNEACKELASQLEKLKR